ncbi:MAG: DUF4340 domain-containing protein [Proteobacteria bacterium]|nr:DUF4340 domain-containing protein [Pseudomonadota bacterium]
MSNKKFSYLVLALVAFIVLYFFTIVRDQDVTSLNGKKLFQDISFNEVRKIKVEQESKAVELELKDGIWRVLNKNGYAADSSKIRSLMLKVFDLTVSQSLNTSEAQLEKLGLTDDAVKRGNAKLTLLGEQNKILTVLRLGQGRKSKTNQSMPLVVAAGQYVKRDDTKDVFIIDTPISLSSAESEWLDLNLINVLPSSIKQVYATAVTNNSEQVLFKLTKDSGKNALVLDGGLVEGKSLQENVASQIQSALENLRISNVLKPEEDILKDVDYDREMIFNLSSGLVYKIKSASKGESNFLKFSVIFSPELLDKSVEQAEPAKEETTTASETASPSATPTASPVAPKASSKEEAEKLNVQLSAWVYELPAYQARKFRFLKSDLTDPPKPPSANKTE